MKSQEELADAIVSTFLTAMPKEIDNGISALVGLDLGLKLAGAYPYFADTLLNSIGRIERELTPKDQRWQIEAADGATRQVIAAIGKILNDE